MDEFSRDMEAWGGERVSVMTFYFRNLGFFKEDEEGREPVLYVDTLPGGAWVVRFWCEDASVELGCTNKLTYDLFMRYASAAGRMWAAYKEVF